MKRLVKILVFANRGAGSNEEHRISQVLEKIPYAELVIFPFDRANKTGSALRLLNRVRELRPGLLVMENTGLAGGIVCLLARLLYAVPYVVSSGDAVGPFIASHYPGLGWIGGIYERTLCRFCIGYMGWTPYLVGRAMTFGARRAITSMNWMEKRKDASALAESRCRIRSELGVGEHDLVFGMLGSLVWNPHKKYCYGWELVEAISRTKRPDIRVLIIGGGTGADQLRQRAQELQDERVFIRGPVPFESVPDWMSAMDIGSLPQTMDKVGMFRYTTKVCEYLQAGIPIVVSRIPMAYDLAFNWGWRLPGDTPWGDKYINALAGFMEVVTADQVRKLSSQIPDHIPIFDKAYQQKKIGQWITDIIENAGGS